MLPGLAEHHLDRLCSLCPSFVEQVSIPPPCRSTHPPEGFKFFMQHLLVKFKTTLMVFVSHPKFPARFRNVCEASHATSPVRAQSLKSTSPCCCGLRACRQLSCVTLTFQHVVIPAQPLLFSYPVCLGPASTCAARWSCFRFAVQLSASALRD